MRAIRARYDPYEQTRGRVDQLRSLGHNVDKVRLVPTLSCSRSHVAFIGGVYCDGWDIHEHARGIPKQVHRPAAQCTVWIYWP